MRKAFGVAVLSALAIHAIVSAQQAPVAGPNRNGMGGPVVWDGQPFTSHLRQGDPFGQRQN